MRNLVTSIGPWNFWSVGGHAPIEGQGNGYAPTAILICLEVTCVSRNFSNASDATARRSFFSYAVVGDSPRSRYLHCRSPWLAQSGRSMKLKQMTAFGQTGHS